MINPQCKFKFTKILFREALFHFLVKGVKKKKSVTSFYKKLIYNKEKKCNFKLKMKNVKKIKFSYTSAIRSTYNFSKFRQHFKKKLYTLDLIFNNINNH